jgi:membrane-bound serine protease (ClpP class)
LQIGGPLPGLPGSAPDKDGKDKKDDAQPPALKDAVTAKATNDAVALIRSLAELRGRNADWAEKAVREAASLSASGALQANVIDVVARNPTELLQLIDGRTVELAVGETRQLATKGLTIERLDPGWLIRLLSVITDPSVAFILLMVGIYGLIFEFSTPGDRAGSRHYWRWKSRSPEGRPQIGTERQNKSRRFPKSTCRP